LATGSLITPAQKTTLSKRMHNDQRTDSMSDNQNNTAAKDRDVRDDSPLLDAVLEGREDEVRSLLAEGADPTGVFGRFDQTLLQVACNRGHAVIALALTEAGLTLTREDDRGNTPLHMAVCSALMPGRAEAACALMQLLLNADAQPTET